MYGELLCTQYTDGYPICHASHKQICHASNEQIHRSKRINISRKGD